MPNAYLLAANCLTVGALLGPAGMRIGACGRLGLVSVLQDGGKWLMGRLASSCLPAVGKLGHADGGWVGWMRGAACASPRPWMWCLSHPPSWHPLHPWRWYTCEDVGEVVNSVRVLEFFGRALRYFVGH